MLRRITKNFGRFKEGAVKNYPKDVWDKIAKDAATKHRINLKARNDKPLDLDAELEKFSEAIDEKLGIGFDAAQRVATAARLKRLSLRTKLSGART